MKKLLLTITILVLFAALVACGSEATVTTEGGAETTLAPVVTTVPAVTAPATTAPVTTAPIVTTAPVTTVPVTTTPDTTPIVLEPTSISYTMFMGGYYYTQFDDAGRTSVRYIYDGDIMQKTGVEFHYAYDESGKLATYTILLIDESLVYTLTYEKDGKTALATSAKDDETSYRFTFDDNGKIAAEETLEGEEVVSRLDYDENGFIVKETIYFRGMAIEYETVYDGEIAIIVCDLPNAATELCVTYNEAGYPISLEGQQLSTEYWNVYTYNEKMLCATANFMDGFYEYYYTFTYDDNDRLVGSVMESDEGVHETNYAYNEKGQKIRLEEKDYYTSGELNYCYVSVYEYDDKGNCIKVISYEDGDEESYVYKWTYTYTYNEAGLPVEETATYTTSSGGFIADFKDYYEYDEEGREIKFTMIEYDKKGAIVDKTVYEYEYNENGDLIKETYSRYDDKGNLIDQEVTDYTEE